MKKIIYLKKYDLKKKMVTLQNYDITLFKNRFP